MSRVSYSTGSWDITLDEDLVQEKDDQHGIFIVCRPCNERLQEAENWQEAEETNEPWIVHCREGRPLTHDKWNQQSNSREHKNCVQMMKDKKPILSFAYMNSFEYP